MLEIIFLNFIFQQPKEKATEHANTFLDISNAVFERLLNLEPASEDPESSLSQRVSNLARRIGTGIRTQANYNIVEPCQRQLHSVVEQLQKGLVLVNFACKLCETKFILGRLREEAETMDIPTSRSTFEFGE